MQPKSKIRLNSLNSGVLIATKIAYITMSIFFKINEFERESKLRFDLETGKANRENAKISGKATLFPELGCTHQFVAQNDDYHYINSLMPFFR